jgi:hypothetical protein
MNSVGFATEFTENREFFLREITKGTKWEYWEYEMIRGGQIALLACQQ